MTTLNKTSRLNKVKKIFDGKTLFFSQRPNYITDHKSPIWGTLIEWKAIFDIEGMQRK